MTRLTCPLCLTALPDGALLSSHDASRDASHDASRDASRDADHGGSRDEQRRLDRALWAAIHALQEQAAAASMLLQLRPDVSGATRQVAAELQAQVETLHALLSCRASV